MNGLLRFSWSTSSLPSFLFGLGIWWCYSQGPLLAQSDTVFYHEERQPFVRVNGYIKELGILSTSRSLQMPRYDNTIHNRFNSHWTWSSTLSFKADLRTRFFNGFSVENTRNTFKQALEQDIGLLDLSWVWLDSEHMLAHSTLDRLFLIYAKEKWELSLGRQRINWGRTFIWNPNDLFNTYAYLDFDYEERPGTDAVRFQYFSGYASGWELALAPGRKSDEWVAAFMYRFNRNGYDIQILGGNFREELALGLGWAGGIKGLGFKGEVTYFHPRHFWNRQIGFVSGTLGADYGFPSSLYLQAEFLFNGNWHRGGNAANIFADPLPANNLYIARTAFFLGGSFQVHPLINTGLAGIFAPDESLYVFVPSLTLSLSQNLDFLITAQFLRNRSLESLSSTGNLFYFRLKQSF